MSDTDERIVDLNKIDAEKLLIVFYASWCPHCQSLIPELNNFYTSQPEKKFEVIAVSLDDKKDEWLNFIRNNKLTWINVSERLKFSNSKIPKSFGVYAVPTCILVNAKGKITYNSDQEDTGLDKLEAAIKQTI